MFLGPFVFDMWTARSASTPTPRFLRFLSLVMPPVKKIMPDKNNKYYKLIAII